MLVLIPLTKKKIKMYFTSKGLVCCKPINV